METATASVSFAPPAAIPPAELERLYRIRMSLSPEQRAEVERQYAELQQGTTQSWRGAESLDPVEASSFSVPDDPDLATARSGLFANLPNADERARAGLYANLPVAPEQTPAAPQPPSAPARRRVSADVDPISQPSAPFQMAQPAPVPMEEPSPATDDMAVEEEQEWVYTGPTAAEAEPLGDQTPRSLPGEAANRFWNNPGVKEQKIKRMAAAAGIPVEQARAMVAQGGIDADGMTDDARNLTAAGRATEFQALRDAATDRRNRAAEARMNAWKAQSMLAGPNPRKNMANAMNALDEQRQQAALQFLLAGGRGASPLDVQGQQALASRGVAEAQVLNEGRMQQTQAELAAKTGMFGQQLQQDQARMEMDRQLRIRQMEEESDRDLRGIRARAEAAANQSRIDNSNRMDETIARISGQLGASKLEADAARYRADKEAQTLIGRSANPAQMALTAAQLANAQADRRRALLEAATTEANRYADDRGAFNNSPIRQWGWDPTLVDANEVSRLRSYLRAMDPQATDQEIETVLEAALRNKTRGR